VGEYDDADEPSVSGSFCPISWSINSNPGEPFLVGVVGSINPSSVVLEKVNL
jgi:hypothetical protein